MSFLGSVRETENTQYPNTVGDFEYVRATGVYAVEMNRTLHHSYWVHQERASGITRRLDYDTR
jgi:hypothetical protein